MRETEDLCRLRIDAGKASANDLAQVKAQLDQCIVVTELATDALELEKGR
jgi:hypothetical protein